MSKKPWSISTTVRNPDRIKGFLEVLSKFEGKVFDEEQQINYQIALIQKKLYKPTGLDSKLLKYYDSLSDMTSKQAEEIFEHMMKQSTVLGEDRGLRGRTSVAPLGKMGLSITKKTSGKVKITEFGKKYLKGEIDTGEVFLRYFFTWSLHNPDSKNFTKKDGFNIRPFIATIRIIKGVNDKLESLGYKTVGISKQEFHVFVPTTINYKDIEKTVGDIVNLRNSLNGKSKSEQEKIKKKYFHDRANRFFNDTNGEHCELNLSNLKDYGDNIIRYFKLTRFFHIRGEGYYVDIEPRRKIEIDSLLEYSDGRRLELNDIESYRKFIDSEIEYPWETTEKLKAIVTRLMDDTIRIDKSLEKPLGVEKELAKIDIKKLTKNELKSIIREIRKKRKDVQEYKNHLDLIDPEKLKEIIERLHKIHNSEESSIELEYLATMCLHAINDALKIQPNYPVGDDNKPTFTAPANVPDIECFYKSFCLICEVTMQTDRSQWFSEGQPVMRHLRDFENMHDNGSICLFIAPRIHRDTFNTFNSANKYEYEGKRQKIIPLSITQFLKILNRVLEKKNANNPITQEEFRELLEKLYSIIIKTNEVGEWAENANKLLNEYEAGEE